MLNFNWWVNRKDPAGRNVFAGGFLGLDNIGVFDRSAPAPHGRLPGAGGWDGVDGVLLPEHAGDGPHPGANPTRCTRRSRFKFVQHFMWISVCDGQDRRITTKMWDEEDGFFYDVLRLPDGQRDASEGAVAGRTSAAVRIHCVRSDAATNSRS